MHIPHASIVCDLHHETEIRAELLDGRGIATERIRHANIVSFVCLKAFAFDDRLQNKDAYDMLYCIEHAPGGVTAAARAIRDAITGTVHGDTIRSALDILRRRFTTDSDVEGHTKDGPVAVASFEREDLRNADLRILRQRNVNTVIQRLLYDIQR